MSNLKKRLIYWPWVRSKFHAKLGDIPDSERDEKTKKAGKVVGTATVVILGLKAGRFILWTGLFIPIFFVVSWVSTILMDLVAFWRFDLKKNQDRERTKVESIDPANMVKIDMRPRHPDERVVMPTERRR